jgi:hypothetical protein
MNLKEEQVIELFEQFLDENYYVGELTEENVRRKCSLGI